MRVLHVTEAYAGGVATSIAAMVEQQPGVEHGLLFASREAQPTAVLGEFVFQRELRTALISRVGDVRRAVRDFEPDLIHAHSSFAGAQARLRKPLVPVVYTPHCFAFERRDLSPLARLGYRAIERVLAPRTAVLAGCSVRETQLGTELNIKQVIYIPNVAAGDLAPREQAALGGPLVFAGRICPQKDPEFAMEVVIHLRELGYSGEIQWLGGGDSKMVQALEDVGVEVTGWLDRAELINRMQGAAVYMHTAAWEGFPMAVLEAARIGLPIVARFLPALADMPPSEMSRDAGGIAVRTLHLLRDEEERALNQARWAAAIIRNTPAEQTKALGETYRIAINGSRR